MADATVKEKQIKLQVANARAEESGGGYEVLPPNTFDGTGVNTAMVHIYKDREK